MWKKIKNLHWLVKLFIIIDFIVLLCFVVVYGPIDKARVFWITTAMETKDHQYLANIFYSEDTIKSIMSENYLKEIDEDTDVSSITIGQEEKITSYTSVYEKEVLEHEEGALYKLIQFKYGDFDCHMVAIYDPKRVEVAYNKKLNHYDCNKKKDDSEEDDIPDENEIYVKENLLQKITEENYNNKS